MTSLGRLRITSSSTSGLLLLLSSLSETQLIDGGHSSRTASGDGGLEKTSSSLSQLSVALRAPEIWNSEAAILVDDDDFCFLWRATGGGGSSNDV